MFCFSFDINNKSVNFIKGKPYYFPNGVTYTYIGKQDVNFFAEFDCSAGDVLWQPTDEYNKWEKSKTDYKKHLRKLYRNGLLECVSKLSEAELNYIYRQQELQEYKRIEYLKMQVEMLKTLRR